MLRPGSQGLISRESETGDVCGGLAKQSGCAVAGGEALEVRLEPSAELVIAAPLATADETIDFHGDPGGCQRTANVASSPAFEPLGGVSAAAVATLLLSLQVPPAFKPT
jgi:hypothetical protein